MSESEVQCTNWERSSMFVMQLRKNLITKHSLDFHCFVFVLPSVCLVIYQAL